MAKSTDQTENEELETDLDTEVDDESQDETAEDEDSTDDTDTEETDDDSDDSEDEDEAESDEDEDAEGFEKRFTQFKGDTPAEYLKNLENGHAASLKEAARILKESKQLQATVDKVNALVAANPELAKALNVEAPTEKPVPQDPAVEWAKAEMQRTFKQDYDKFVETHPEIETDPILAEDLNKSLAIVRDVVYQQEGRQVGMAEGLRKAWKLLDKDDTQEKVRMAVKDTAAKGKTANGKKTASTDSQKFGEDQIHVTMEMMGVDRSAALKVLSKYKK